MARVSRYVLNGGELCAVIHGRDYVLDASKPPVIALHGLNGLPWHPLAFPDAVLEEMIRRGYLVASPAAGGPAAWGNDAAQATVGTWLTWLVANMGAKAGGGLIVTGSMGTLTGLNRLRLQSADVLALAGRLPALDLVDLHSQAALLASIEAAYGGAAAYPGVRAAHNPSENMGAYTAAMVAKGHLFYSADDDVVRPGTVQAFAAGTGMAATNLGATGGHVFPSDAATVAAVCDFLESKA